MAGAESLNADLPKGLETHQLLVMVVGEVFLPNASTDQLLVWGSREALLPDESTDQLVSGAPAHWRRPRLKQCVVFTVPLSRNQPIADHSPYRTLTLKHHYW